MFPQHLVFGLLWRNMMAKERLMQDQVQLGDNIQDAISGFTGIATALAVYITGCKQVLVQPPMKATGEFVESRWFDMDRMTILTKKAFTLPVSSPGSDKLAPRR
jgi:hypothetical protein